MKLKLLLIISLFFVLFGCKVNYQKLTSKGKLSYLALGDSYTIGESVEPAYRWPVQLVKKLNEKGFLFNEPKIIAQTGWRTDNLLYAIDAEPHKAQYNLVSILIGVNNQYQGKSIEQYKDELNTILEKAISYSKKGSDGVFMVSIPDYGVTPFGLNSGKENISKELKTYNIVAKETAQNYKIPFYNITDISLKAETDTSLVANDGLHPSRKMYALWADNLLPKVKRLLKN